MSNQNKCPKCNSENTYQDVNLWVCSECFHEWDPSLTVESVDEAPQSTVVLDSNGNILNTGDSVIVIKDLKVKGSPTGIKSGTKVKNIQVVESNDGHNISCKVDGIGAMHLKSEFVKKA